MGEDHLSVIPSDRTIEQAIVVLKKGAHLLRNRRGKPKFCSFKLSEDEKFLIWYSGQEEKQLRLSSVTRIIRGASNKQLPVEKDCQCFSLIYGSSQHSLDLICKDKEQAETWILGLRAVITRNCSPRLLDSWRNQRGSQSCINSPAGFMRRKQVLGLLEKTPSSQVYSLSGSPAQSFSEKYCPDGSSCSSNSIHTESSMSSMHKVKDVFIPKSPYLGQDEENRRAVSFMRDVKTNMSSEFTEPVHDSLKSEKQVFRDVWIWGEGVDGGYLGGGETQSDALLPKLLDSTMMLDVQTITLGRNHAALVTKQGEIFCWGEGKRGRLGHKLDTDATCPKIVDSLTTVNVKSVACGEYQTCALTHKGEVYTWGDNCFIGEDRRRSPWLPNKLSGSLDGVTISQVACGVWHTAIVSTTGQLFTHGDGTFGVLGHGNLQSVSQPKEVESLKGLWLKSVACGPWHTAAIVDITVDRLKLNKLGGKLFTWGDGDKGRLGHSDQMMKLLPTCVSKLVDHDFVQVSCGRDLTVGLSNMGKVYTMGSAMHGQLGNPQAIDKSISVVQGKLKGEFVRDISSGCYHVAALTSRGNVYTWGSGANGQLGVGDTKDRNSPTLVEALKDKEVLHITCGSSLTAAICLHKSISSADQSACRGCSVAFSFARKKHNCYNCGLSFCHSCSSKKATNASLAPIKSKPFRVCDLCFNQLQRTPYSKSLSRIVASSPRPLMVTKKLFSDRKEGMDDPDTLCSRVTSIRHCPGDNSRYYQGKIIKQEQNLLMMDPDLYSLGGLPRWGQVSCPEGFGICPRVENQPPHVRNGTICSQQIPSPLKVVTSLPKNSGDEFPQPDKFLTEEVQKLRDQVESLKNLCQNREQKIQECERKIEEAWALAKDEACKSKAAKEVIRALTSRLHLMSQKVLAERDAQDHACGNLSQVSHSSVGSPKQKGLLHPLVVGQKEDLKVDSLSSSPIVFSNTIKSLRERDHHDDVKSAEKPEGMNPSKHEWVEQYEPGVYITLTTVTNGQKGLKRVRFSRKRFNEKDAERWWDENQLQVYQRYEIEG